MKNIVCLSTSNYRPFPTRKQNVMNRLTDCNIIYVDPPVTYIAPLKDKAAKLQTKRYKQAPEHALPHLWVYAQKPVLPFYYKRRGINVVNQKRFAKYLAGIINSHGFGTDFCLWVYSPMYADLIAPLAKELGMEAASLWKNTVYDCVDRHSAYPGHLNPELVDAMEEDLACGCGTVFATAQGLYNRLKQFNQNCFLVPNGANFELFNKVALCKNPKPVNPKAPVFGFVGMLQDCIDYSAIRALALAYPQGKIQFVGRKLAGVDLSLIEKLPNVEFLGLKPQEELPEIIKNFDVCLNLFADNNLSKDVSPLKFYEYLATGKPVVSTPVPLQVWDYKNCIYICKGAEDIAEKAAEALAEAGEEKQQMRIQKARECSWDERVKTIRTKLFL